MSVPPTCWSRTFLAVQISKMNPNFLRQWLLSPEVLSGSRVAGLLTKHTYSLLCFYTCFNDSRLDNRLIMIIFFGRPPNNDHLWVKNHLIMITNKNAGCVPVFSNANCAAASAAGRAHGTVWEKWGPKLAISTVSLCTTSTTPIRDGFWVYFPY